MNPIEATWQPFREPLWVTVRRTGLIALIAGVIFAAASGRLANWPAATLLLLWPSFGGHWIELWFLNYLRPRLPSGRAVQVAARIVTWFAGGIILTLGALLTAAGMGIRAPHWLAWWLGGLAFIAIELTVHLVLLLRGKRNFYNGRA
jgi:hypothetical protein